MPESSGTGPGAQTRNADSAVFPKPGARTNDGLLPAARLYRSDRKHDVFRIRLQVRWKA